MKAIDIMKQQIYCIDSEHTLRDALEVMDDAGIDELPVVEDEHFLGVITADAIHSASQRLGPFEEIPDRPVADLVGYGTTCTPREEGFKVLDHMEQDDSYHSYVVTDAGLLIGEINFDDLAEALPSEVNTRRPPQGWGSWQAGRSDSATGY